MSNLNLDIIPKPLKIEIGSGHFSLQNNFKVFLDPALDLAFIPKFITDHLVPATGYQFEVTKQETADFCFNLQEGLAKEEYQLQVTTSQTKIFASTFSGHLYGLITFMQLLPPEIFSSTLITNTNWEAPNVTISDKPRFGWRGLHLDCSRHFFTIEQIQQLLCWMALHKLNVFHWHLTDDQGWRFESKLYPKLNEISTVRIEKDNTLYGPYIYTQEEIKNLISYAKALNITIVPEIDLPGHSCAALAAYPEFACGFDAPYKVKNTWGIFPEIYCVGNENAVKFLKDILTEVISVFDSEFIHIGGDECKFQNWQKCPKCQEAKKKGGFLNNYELFFSFIRDIAQFINQQGRKMIGWNECIADKYLIPEGNAGMVWQDSSCAPYVTDECNRKAVMTPMNYLYFDHCQYDYSYHDQHNYIGGYSPLEKVYEYDPCDEVTNTANVLGCQANVWCEFIPNFLDAQWKIFPRMCALSEIAWTERENKDFKQFKQSLDNIHLKRLDIMHIKYANLQPQEDDDE